MEFIVKDSTEIVEISDEICVAGLSLQKSGLPISFGSLGKLWERYGETYRGKIKNAGMPAVEYGVCLNKVPDYITGCGVSSIEELEEAFASFVIPKGSYIKDTFNAETFEKLTTETMGKRKVKAWAKKNNVKVGPSFTIEVYPAEEFEKGNFEMYTLTPVKK